jgi:hypothetical protein
LVSVANIQLSLSASRVRVKTWVIVRWLGELVVSVENPAGIPVAKYVIYRKAGSGEFQALVELPVSATTGAELRYQDKWLAKNTIYTYRVEAVDAAGKVVGRSEDRTI